MELTCGQAQSASALALAKNPRYATFVKVNMTMLVLNLTAMFAFVYFNLTIEAPGVPADGIGDLRLAYALLGFFAAMIAASTTSVVLCCPPVAGGVVDSAQLFAYCMFDALSLAAYLGALWLMLRDKFGGTGIPVLLNAMLALTASNVGSIVLSLWYAHGFRQVAPQPMCEIDSEHEVETGNVLL